MGVIKIDINGMLERISAQDISFYLYGTGNLCKTMLSGELDLLFRGVQEWKDKITGFIDQNTKTKLGFFEDKKVVTPDKFVQEINRAVILLCTGISKRHRNEYEDVISKLTLQNKEYYLITAYDLMKGNYYREECGVLEAAGIFKVLDMPRYLASAPWYFYKAFDRSKNYSYLSAKNIEKWISSCSAIMTRSKQIGIRDVRSSYFNVLNGRRLVPCEAGEYKNRIHMFGDSRILSIRTNDEETIASYLQVKLRKGQGKDYKVLNYGMPMFSLERILYQVLNANYKAGDIIIIGGGIKQTLEKSPEDWIELLDCLYQICYEKKVQLLLFHCPCIYELNNLTYIEQFILDAFHFLMDSLKCAAGQKWLEFEVVCNKRGFILIDMCSYEKQRYLYGECYVDAHHYGPNGNLWIADGLYHAIRVLDAERHVVNQFIPIEQNRNSLQSRSLKSAQLINDNSEYHGLQKEELEQLDAYLKNCKKQMPENGEDTEIGAIVMNCNPFTLGHKYLIETAAACVDHLMVFVVEENKSFFDLKDRIFLVKEGCKEFTNVTVFPSGKFMISATTFPEYFCKDTVGDSYIDSSTDLSLFGEYIAPYFGIKRRFVGEEPIDAVTRQYNETMKEILEDYGVKVIEIKRKEAYGGVISASRVRKLLKAGRYEEIKPLVPEITYHYLTDNYMKREIG